MGKEGNEVMSTKILLVEDDREIVKNLTEFLQGEGFLWRR